MFSWRGENWRILCCWVAMLWVGGLSAKDVWDPATGDNCSPKLICGLELWVDPAIDIPEPVEGNPTPGTPSDWGMDKLRPFLRIDKCYSFLVGSKLISPWPPNDKGWWNIFPPCIIGDGLGGWLINVPSILGVLGDLKKILKFFSEADQSGEFPKCWITWFQEHLVQVAECHQIQELRNFCPEGS